jgi:hypothetical protein
VSSQSGSFSGWTSTQLNTTFGSPSPSGITVTDTSLGLEFVNTTGVQKATSDVYNNASVYTFTVPSGISTLEMGMIGGGGGGAVGPCINGSGGGGGATYHSSYSVSAGATITVRVAAGGRAGYTNARNGTSAPYGVVYSPYKGGTSSVAINGSVVVSASGGAGGKYDDACGSSTTYNSDGYTTAAAAPGGSGSGGTANYSGGSGEFGGHNGCGGGRPASPLGGSGTGSPICCGAGASGIGGGGATWTTAGSAGSCGAGVQSMSGSSFGAGGGSMETDGTTDTYVGYVGHGAPGMVRIIFR